MSKLATIGWVLVALLGLGFYGCDGPEDLLIFIIADNPIGELSYYPDSKKWLVRSPQRRLMRGAELDYYDGEE